MPGSKSLLVRDGPMAKGSGPSLKACRELIASAGGSRCAVPVAINSDLAISGRRIDVGRFV